MALLGRTGARSAVLSPFRRLVAGAIARDLQAVVLPGPDVARARGLDIAGAGLRLAATPRHAGVLLIAGALPEGLRDAASVIFAQMPRPRVILALDVADLAPLPKADVTAGLSQDGLLAGLTELRRIVAAGAFGGEVEDFLPPVLETKIEYTCSMHPEVIRDEPGACPKCGMDLVAREASAGGGRTAGHTAGHTVDDSAHTKPDHELSAPAHSAHDHTTHTATQYTCSMHPEVLRDEPGSCPKCGMFLEPVKKDGDEDHSGHGHQGHGDHAAHAMAEAVAGIEPQFMSMVDLTRGQPRSSDGLQMDWIEVPFGPFFPGLPGGLALEFTLDGDTVVKAAARSAVGADPARVSSPLAPGEFLERIMQVMPLSPVSYGLLALTALENAAGVATTSTTARGRAGALERERIASHLSWLAAFGLQAGFGWLASRAGALQLQVQNADVERIAALAPTINGVLRRVKRTPFLRARLAGIGQLERDAEVAGPVARALGHEADGRDGDKTYGALGFAPVMQSGGDALARLLQYCDEVAQSIKLIAAAGVITVPELADFGPASGEAEAIIETPRGAAKLWLRLETGQVTTARLETPSMRHLALIGQLTDQHELGDALVAVASLDISPWEIPVRSGSERHS